MLLHNPVARFVIPLVLLLGIVLLPARTALAADAVAMVTDLQGPARLVEEGRQRPLALLEYLRPGHEVRLGKNARVTLIYFQSGTQYVAGGEGHGAYRGGQTRGGGRHDVGRERNPSSGARGERTQGRGTGARW